MNNPVIISDSNKKSLKIKSFLIKNSEILSSKSNVIIVIGGDGFMLKTLKKNKGSLKYFYGINSGNYGFLMNKFSTKNTIKNISKAKMITIFPLELIVKAPWSSRLIRSSLILRVCLGCPLMTLGARPESLP